MGGHGEQEDDEARQPDNRGSLRTRSEYSSALGELFSCDK